MNSSSSLGPMARFSSVLLLTLDVLGRRGQRSRSWCPPRPRTDVGRRPQRPLWRDGAARGALWVQPNSRSDVDALAVEGVRGVDDEVLARADVAAHEQLEHPLRPSRGRQR